MGPAPKRARKLYDPFLLICSDGTEHRIEFIDLVRACKRIEQLVDDFEGDAGRPDRLTLPPNFPSSAVSSLVEVIETFETGFLEDFDPADKNPALCDSYVDVCLLADYLQIREDLHRALQSWHRSSVQDTPVAAGTYR
ncbi:hypothetical protein WJX73_001318 [Symbiochloris irregularis]|uniref:Uncharacterized protein n=1 Tax=Symbiochloris irregularis TaxID=706552 RepID=A0AAW1NVG3_9CHLO